MGKLAFAAWIDISVVFCSLFPILELTIHLILSAKRYAKSIRRVAGEDVDDGKTFRQDAKCAIDTHEGDIPRSRLNSLPYALPSQKEDDS